MKTIVCLASGASLTHADVDYCRGKADVLVVNDNYRLAPWANWLYAADRHWWDRYADDVTLTFHGERWTCNKGAADHYGLHHVVYKEAPGLHRGEGTVNTGRNSGYQAINLAYHFGAQRIILLGYDMQGTHWFGEHPSKFRSKNDFSVFIPQFDALAADLKAEGIEVINCTRDTALHAFPQSTIEEVL